MPKIFRSLKRSPQPRISIPFFFFALGTMLYSFSQAEENPEASHYLGTIENPPTEESHRVARATLAYPAREILRQYVRPGSELAKKDKKNPSPQEAALLFHLFPTGPYGENVNDFGIFEPKLYFASGNNCQNKSPLEFSVLWKRNQNGDLEISKVGLHLGASHSKKVSKDKVSLPEPIYGVLAPYALEAGKVSYHFSPEFKELVEKENIRIETDIEDKANGQRELGFLVNGRRIVPRINQDTSLTISGRNGDRATGILMPFSVHFAPRSEGLFESERWAVIRPTGTAVHGADYSNLGRRSASNAGSAGCARVQNSMAATLHKEISDLLTQAGAHVGRNGNFFITEENLRENGTLKGQVLSETEQNLINIKAMLEVRSKVSMESFNPSSTQSLYTYYYRSWEVAKSRLDQAAGQSQNLEGRIQQYQSYVQSLQNRGGLFRNKEKDRLELQGAQRNLRQLLANHEKSKSQVEILRQEEQILKKKLFSLESQYDNSTPLHSPSPEIKVLYKDPKNRRQLDLKIAEALEEYYRSVFGSQLPPGCRQFVEAYRGSAQKASR